MYTNRRRQIAVMTPKIYKFSVRNLLYFTILAPIISMWLLGFLCTPDVCIIIFVSNNLYYESLKSYSTPRVRRYFYPIWSCVHTSTFMQIIGRYEPVAAVCVWLPS